VLLCPKSYFKWPESTIATHQVFQTKINTEQFQHILAVGQTATLGNFAKATYYAIQRTYSYLTPDLWKEQKLDDNLYDTKGTGAPAAGPGDEQ
jgi:hypothetical protein